jgi:choice-of-anchor A domain-containing protein
MLRRWSFLGGVTLAALSVWYFATPKTNALASAPALASAKNVECLANPLAIDASLTGFILENVSVHDTDFAGGLLLGGNAAFRNSNVGSAQDDSSRRLDVEARGNVDFLGGAVPHGVLSAAGNVSQNDAVLSFPVQKQFGMEKFLASQEKITAISRQLAKLTAKSLYNFHNPIGERREIYLQAFAEGANVFIVEGNDLANAHTLRVEGDEKSTVLIIVRGTTVNINAVAPDFIGVKKENVLYFFPEAEALRVRSSRVQGSLLAPLAHMEFVNAVFEGQVVAKSLSGKGEFRKSVFAGCLALE